MSGMRNDRKPVGSFRLWLWVRALEALLIAWWVMSPKFWNLWDLLFFLTFVYIAYLTDPMSYGYADDNGILFRRYFKQSYVRWNDVGRIDWRPWSSGGIRVFLRRGPAWRRTLHFDLNPTLKEAFAEFRGRSTPEIVLWIQERINSSADR